MGKTWFLFGVLVVILLNCFMSSSTNLTNYDEFSLLAFKSHLTLDPQNILATNWSTTTTTSICNWIGVVCSFPNRRVISLNLSNMSLSGTIAPHLGNLSFLNSLDLSYNSFHGIIPTEICNLPNLEFLALRYNNLTGSIPRSLFNISSLTSVDLTANDLYDVLPVDMCTHLTSLEGLFLSVNRLHGQIPTNIYKCRKLQRLSLSFNEFYGRIPREIGNITMLEDLYLGINSLTGIEEDISRQMLAKSSGLNIHHPPFEV